MNHTRTKIALILALLVFPLTANAITFRTPVVNGTLINNMYDNDDTVGVKKLYNCSVSTSSGKDDNHHGVDFPVSAGSTVVAGAEGRVVQEANNCANTGSLSDTCGSGYGNHYRLDHEGDTTDAIGLTSIYAHLSSASVTIPLQTAVSCAQPLGLSAASGQVTGPHLHFELRTNGSDLNTKTDPFDGSCAHPGVRYWTGVSNGQPTAQCNVNPLSPSNMSVTNPTKTSLVVNFRDNSSSETSISVERKEGSGSWAAYTSFAALAGGGLWNWTDTGLDSATAYCYRLRALTAGGSSGYSNEVCGTTLTDTSIPLAPSLVTVISPTINTLTVNFKDNSYNEASILIERKIGTTGSWASYGALNGTSGATTWNWVDSGLSSATYICYRLRSTNTYGTSGYSNESCGTTATNSLPPLAPSNVFTSAPTVSSIVVNFTDNANNESSTLIERKVGTTGTWVALGSFAPLFGTANWSWMNTGLNSKTTYCYRFKSMSAYGNSGYSNESCGTTL